ncbi:hypothetical protein C7999DRAFT_44585 [Corynascus novoguineensis]|uniref:Uncharacterized protein n=1 Tax=Corynascus novoguineensis TaxID=1126955 RepID=A0AAN7CKU8_9PEZI|nr:hypothetical protein C7999DRAFT_44585 [Corynascus novoguineensis]
MALPLELLAEICTYFCWYCQVEGDDDPAEVMVRARDGQASLANLSRTCRVMQEVAQPLLFHRVYASRESDLYLLVRALVDRPEVGSRLSEVIVTTPHQARDTARSERIAEIVEEDLRIGDVWAPAWERFTAGERFAALTSLLLHFAPTLTSASFHLLGPPSRVIGQALRRWNTSVQHLTSLRRLTLAAYKPDPFHRFELDHIVYLLRAVPSLEHFRGLGDGGMPIPNPPRLPNLTELVLTDCSIARRGLANLVHAVGDRLSKVTVRKTTVRSPREYAAESDFTIVSLELEQVLQTLLPRWGGTLREFTYRVPCRLRAFDAPAPTSLSGFSALERLDICTDAVDFASLEYMEDTDGVFASWLPPSLRELRVCGPAVIVGSLGGLLDAVIAGRLQDLTRVEITDQEFGSASSGVLTAQSPPDGVRRYQQTVAGLRSMGVNVMIHPRGPESE